MKRFYLVFAFIWPVLILRAQAPLVINEVDYDQAGTDAEEFIEIKNAGETPANLAGTVLQLINGSLGIAYGAVDLPDETIEAGGYYVVCFGPNNASYCDTTVAGSIQNGAPDAVGLFFEDVPVDLLSYEGDVAGFVEGSGNGLVDDENIPLTGLSRIPDGTDTDDNNADFALVCVTPGRRNLDRMSNCNSTPTVRVQVIHNAPSPVVDIYAGDMLLFDNFSFRMATPFLEIPAEVEINIGVALSNSTSVEDTLASFPMIFEYGKTYVVTAGGIVGDVTTPLTLHVNDNARETATESGKVDIAVLHGSPDAPNIDIDARGAGNLISNLAYGAYAGYFSLDPVTLLLDIRAAGDAGIIAAFEADLNGLAGSAATVFASGLLNGDPAFGLFAAFPDGTIIALPAIATEVNILSDQLGYYRVAPNPVSGIARVQFAVKQPLHLRLHLYDGNGRLLRARELGQHAPGEYSYQLDMAQLPQGIYQVSLISSQGVVNKRIVVNH